MIYKDRLYGKVEITEPVVLELIKTPTLQRLKGVDQAGYSQAYPTQSIFSRFEHSIGVFILLKKYKASLEEQIAGLIHDVSHATFSHCIDYILKAGSEKEHNHQDKVFEGFIKKSEIPSILEKYKLDLNYILDEEIFPLKERSLPDLCADRIDYSLRSTFLLKLIDKEMVNYFLDNLNVENNYWVFSNFESAKKYAELFLKLNSLCYASLTAAAMFKTVGDCIQYALQRGYVTENDLYTTDKEVLQKVKKNLSKDKKLKLLFDRMNNKVKFQNNPQDYDAHVFCKSRVVDPLFQDKGEMQRISEVDKDWAAVVKKESVPKEYFLKFER